MLWLLGLAALGGVCAALFFPDDVAWRTIGTLFLGAVACAFLMLGAYFTGKPVLRLAGQWLMAATLVEFLGILTLIWRVYSDWRIETSAALSLLAWAGTTVWLTLALAVLRRPIAAIAAKFAVVLACVGLPMWLIGIWSDYGGGYAFAENMLDAAGAVWLFGMATAALLTDYSVRRWWMWLGILAAMAGCAIWQGHIWWNLQSNTGIGECIASPAFLLSYLSILRLFRLRPSFAWVQIAATMAAIITTLSIDVLIIAEKRGSAPEIITRLVAASAIATTCASLAVVILRLLGRREIEPQELSDIRELAITCPGCGKKGTMPVGESQCPYCRLGFDIRICEPRCPVCNYLTYMLQSDRCPECGTALAPRSSPTST